MLSRRMWFVVPLLALALCVVGVMGASGQEVEPGLPYGKYTGSVVGGSGGSPLAVTVYISERSGDEVDVTVVVSKLPLPISVRATASRAGGGYNIPVTVSAPRLRLNGSGMLRLRPTDAGWAVYGVGSGSFRGKSGSGRGYAQRASSATGLGEQVADALGGFLSFGAVADEAPQAPPEFSETELDAEPGEGEAAQPPVTVDGDEEGASAPSDAAEILFLSGMMLLAMIIGLFP